MNYKNRQHSSALLHNIAKKYRLRQKQKKRVYTLILHILQIYTYNAGKIVNSVNLWQVYSITLVCAPLWLLISHAYLLNNMDPNIEPCITPTATIVASLLFM